MWHAMQPHSPPQRDLQVGMQVHGLSKSGVNSVEGNSGKYPSVREYRLRPSAVGTM
jgi:hypothetical protein